MDVTSQIQEHMPVVGSDGAHVGTVDNVQGDSIKLTKNDSPDGQHHTLPVSMVERVDEHVHLSVSASEAQRQWGGESESGGSGGQGGQAEGGMGDEMTNAAPY